VEEDVVKYNIYLNDKLKTTSATNTAILSGLAGNNTIFVTAVNRQDLEGPKGTQIKVK
jgi:arginine repressor